MHCNCRSKGSKKPNKKKENKLPSYASQDLSVCLFRLIIIEHGRKAIIFFFRSSDEILDYNWRNKTALNLLGIEKNVLKEY